MAFAKILSFDLKMYFKTIIDGTPYAVKAARMV
jgi:hypothetical protein